MTNYVNLYQLCVFKKYTFWYVHAKIQSKYGICFMHVTRTVWCLHTCACSCTHILSFSQRISLVLLSNRRRIVVYFEFHILYVPNVFRLSKTQLIILFSGTFTRQFLLNERVAHTYGHRIYEIFYVWMYLRQSEEIYRRNNVSPRKINFSLLSSRLYEWKCKVLPGKATGNRTTTHCGWNNNLVPTTLFVVLMI